jgi:SNF family Na+-dependent transporter
MYKTLSFSILYFCLSDSAATVSTWVETMKCMYAPDLEAMKVDISPIASTQKFFGLLKLKNDCKKSIRML